MERRKVMGFALLHHEGNDVGISFLVAHKLDGWQGMGQSFSFNFHMPAANPPFPVANLIPVSLSQESKTVVVTQE